MSLFRGVFVTVIIDTIGTGFRRTDRPTSLPALAATPPAAVSTFITHSETSSLMMVSVIIIRTSAVMVYGMPGHARQGRNRHQ